MSPDSRDAFDALERNIIERSTALHRDVKANFHDLESQAFGLLVTGVSEVMPRPSRWPWRRWQHRAGSKLDDGSTLDR